MAKQAQGFYKYSTWAAWTDIGKLLTRQRYD